MSSPFLVVAPFAADFPLDFSTMLLLEEIGFFAGLEVGWEVVRMDNSVFHRFLSPLFLYLNYSTRILICQEVF